MEDDRVELSVEKETLEKRIGVYDERWLEESKSMLLCDIKTNG